LTWVEKIIEGIANGQQKMMATMAQTR